MGAHRWRPYWVLSRGPQWLQNTPGICRGGTCARPCGRTDATISTVTVQGRPPVAPLQSFFIRSGEPQDHGNFVVNAVSSQPPQKHKEHKESNKFQIPKNWIALLKVNILNLGRIVDQTPRTA